METPGTIVVGLDDTPASRAALRFSVREAIHRDSRLDIVTAWSPSTAEEHHDRHDSADRARALAQHVQDSAVAETIDEFDVPFVLSRQVVEGDPATVLMRTARNADYLVLGSSRAARPGAVRLGAVSGECMEHVRCPVLVVPAPITTHANNRMRVSTDV